MRRRAYARQSVLPRNAEGGPPGGRAREPQTHDPRRPYPQARQRPLFMDAVRAARVAQGRTGGARGDEPRRLWEETGRWELYGPMMLHIKDRAEREFCYAPTAEEVVCDIVRREIRSYRQLPVNFYQVQTKFRDEIRPRFGVMRAREFTMKDAYSFDADFEGLRKSYRAMYEAYVRIFTRLGLAFRAVAADTGEIGGTGSHEFQVLAGSGEDSIAFSPDSDYAANVELAEAVAPAQPR